ncbi:MAG: DUF11 domain-containing protein [Deltaproteobacteria bacterium]|nr:DUF11 domain-containing protein [Deltaproteobacteria bacterium]
MRDALRAAVGAFALAGLLISVDAHASFVVDDNAGKALDDYYNGNSIDSGAGQSSGYALNVFTGTVTLVEAGTPAVIVTRPVTPASFSGWTKVQLRGTFPSISKIHVDFLTPLGNVIPVTAATEVAVESGWQLKVDMSGIDAAQYPSVRLRITMEDTTGNPILPVLDAVRVNWTPLSVLRVAANGASSVASGAELRYEIPISVSTVQGENVVVKLAKPAIANPAWNRFNQATDVSLSSTTNGGQMWHGASTTMSGLQIDDGDIYWAFPNNISPGTTFLLTAVVRVPNGLVDGLVYNTQATIRAANGDPRTSDTVATTVVSHPNPYVSVSTSPTYNVFGQTRAQAGTQMTVSVSSRNFPSGYGTGAQIYFEAVTVHRLDGFQLPAGSAITGPPTNISGNGVYLAAGESQTFFPTSLTPRTVTGPAVVWTAPSIGLGGGVSYSYNVTLVEEAPAGILVENDEITTTASLTSAYDPESANASNRFLIGIPSNPSGVHALGQGSSKQTQIRALNDDLPFTIVAYGEPVHLPVYSSNNGASALNDVVQILSVPVDTTFSSFTATGATIYYNTTSAVPGQPISAPPGYDTATGAFDGTWTTTAPANPASVKWVAAVWPTLASPYFPIPNTPSSGSADLVVVTNPATNGCDQKTLVGDAFFDIRAYTPFGATTSQPNGSAGSLFHDKEPFNVRAKTPSLDYFSVSASPSIRVGAGFVDVTYNVRNQSAYSDTGDATNVTLTAPFPSVLVNAGSQPLNFVSATTDSGAQVLAGNPPSSLTVSWPSLPANTTRTVRIRFAVPAGVLNNATATFSGTVSMDAVDCPQTITGTRSSTTTFNVSPVLTAVKSVDFEAAGPNDDLTYTIRTLNTGDGVATNAFFLDKIPANTSFKSGQPVSGGGTWYFSSSTTLSLSEPQNLTPATLGAAGFQAGHLSNGQWVPPTGMNPTWVWVDLTDQALSPKRFVTNHQVDVVFTVTLGTPPDGTLITNAGAIGADRVLAAVTNRTRTILTENPFAKVTIDLPDVVASDETFTYVTDAYNSANSPDNSFVFVATLPEGLEYVSSNLTFNAAAIASGNYDGVTVTPTVSGDGRQITWDVTAAAGQDLQPLEGVHIDVTVHAADTLTTGTFLTAVSTVVAANVTNPTGVAFSAADTTRIENADVTVTGLIDQPNPVAGETVSLYWIVANTAGHVAENVAFSVTLPPQMTYVPGSVLFTSPGWSFAPSSAPVVTGNTLTWSVPNGNAITGPTGTAGFMPGNSGNLQVTMRATVDPATQPDTTLDISAHIATSTGQGDNAAPDDATVSALTPLPDLAVGLDVPTTARPGDGVTVTTNYRNLSRQGSNPAAVVLPMPAADAAAGVTLLSASAPAGVPVYYSTAPLGGAAPAFDPSDPAAGGWTTTVPAGATWVAASVGAIAGNSSPKNIYLQVQLNDPTTGALLIAGESLSFCAQVAQVVGDPAAEQSLTNNAACKTLKLPGVNLTASITSDPSGSVPGVIAGGGVTLTPGVENTGTTNAFGVVLTPSLPSGLVFTTDTSATPIIVDENGEEAVLVDLSGTPLLDPVGLTKVGNVYYLGSPDPGPTYYRNIGMAPGTKVTFTIATTASTASDDSTNLVTTLAVRTDYQTGWQTGDPEEELLTDNTAQTSVVVYKADAYVHKTMGLATGATGAAGLGDLLDVVIEYNNLGNAPADDVVYTDYFPAGTSFVVGSLQGLPGDFALEYIGDAGPGYVPVGQAGDTDPGVRGFRLTGTLSAPTNGYFNAQGDGLSVGDLHNLVVSGGRLRATGPNATYTSPAIPEDGATVLSYGRIVLTDAIAEESGDITVSIIDPATGVAIAGYDDLVPDASNAVDASGIAPADFPAIQVRVSFGGGGGVVANYDAGATHLLPTPTQSSREEYPNGFNERGEFTLYSYSNVTDDEDLVLMSPNGEGGYDRTIVGPGVNYDPMYFYGDVIMAQDSRSQSVLVAVRDPATGAWDTYNYPIEMNYFTGSGYVYTIDETHFLVGVTSQLSNNTTTATFIYIDLGAPGAGITSSTLMTGNYNSFFGMTPDGEFLYGADANGVYALKPAADYTAIEATQIFTGSFNGIGNNYRRASESYCIYSYVQAAQRYDGYVLGRENGAWTSRQLTAPEGARHVYCNQVIGESATPEHVIGQVNFDSYSQSYVWTRQADGSYLPAPLDLPSSSEGSNWYLAFTLQESGLLVFENNNSGDPGIKIGHFDDTTGDLVLNDLELPDPTFYANAWIDDYGSYGNVSVPMNSFTVELSATSSYDWAYYVAIEDAGTASGYRLVELGVPDGYNRGDVYPYFTLGDRAIGEAYRYDGNNYTDIVAVWDIAQDPAPVSLYPSFEDAFSGYVLDTAGFYAVGYYNNPLDENISDENGTSGPGEPLPAAPGLPLPIEGNNTDADFAHSDLHGDALFWLPEFGAEPDNYAYRLLPRPYRTRDNRATFVSEDGYVAGFGRSKNGYEVGISWVPDGDGGFDALPLVFNKSNRMRLYDNDEMECYGANGNYAGKYAAGYGYDQQGYYRDLVVVRDPKMPNGFAVLPRWRYNGEEAAIDARAAMIGYRDLYGYPAITYSDADGMIVDQVLPTIGDLPGQVIDIFNDRALGIVYDEDGKHTIVWDHVGGAWIPTDYGVFNEPLGLGPNGEVLVNDSGDALVLVPDGAGGAIVMGPDPALISEGDRFSPAYGSQFLPALRDGYFITQYSPGGEDGGTEQYVVSRLPTAEAAGYSLAFTGIGLKIRGGVLQYHANGSLVGEDYNAGILAYLKLEADDTFTRIDAPDGYTLDGYTQNIPFADVIGIYGTGGGGGGAEKAGTLPGLGNTGPAGWRPWLGAEAVTPIEVRLDDNDVLTRDESSVFHFASQSQLEIWGADIGSSASIAGLAVQYRSDAIPSFRYQLAVEDVCQTSISNTMSVSTTTPQSSTDNDSSTATLGIETADLRVTVAASASLVVPGDELGYTVTVTNAGPSTVFGATWSFVPPSALDLDQEGGNVAGASGLAAGQSVTFGPFTTTVDELPDGTSLTAVALLDQGVPFIDCDGTNDQASATATVANLPNVFVTVDAPASVHYGEEFPVTVHYGNDSGAPANAVTVTFTPPAGFVIVGDTTDTTTDHETLSAGEEHTLTYLLKASSCAAVGSSFTSSATIAAALDVFEADNQAAANTAITAPVAVLSATMVADRSTVYAGGVTRWTIHYRNDGTTAVDGVTLTASVPSNATLVAGSLSAGSEAGGVITASVGELDLGEAGAISFATVAGASGNQTGTLSITGDDACPTAGAYPVVVNATLGLTATKAASRATACGDGQITWSITLANQGTADLTGLTVRDAVPAGSALVAGSMTGGNAQNANGNPNLVWTVNTLRAGEGLTLSFRTSAPSSDGALVSNSATVWQGATQVATTNTAVVRVDCDGSVRLQKSVDASCKAPGDLLTISLAYTNTQVGVTGAVIQDLVPDGLIYQSGGSYDAATRVVTFGPTDIAFGGSGTVSFTALIDTATTSGSLVLDSASLTAAGIQPVVSNGVTAMVMLCNDGDVCTHDACDPGLGCVITGGNAGVSCESGDLCAPGMCSAAGSCVPQPIICNDGNDCTSDACVDGACPFENLAQGTACNDHVNCTTDDVCDGAGACGGTQVTCGQIGDSCAFETCNESTGLCDQAAPATAPEGTTCSDGVNCTTGDSCNSEGSCVGAPVVCGAQIGDSCTVETCNESTGLCDGATAAFASAGTTCDDGALCTENDTCDSAGTCAGTTITCGDQIGDSCRFETCNPETGLCDDVAPTQAPTGTECVSEAICTFNAACDAAGDCVGSAPGEDELEHVYFFVLDGETSILLVSTDKVPPLSLGNGFYRRYDLAFVPADAGDLLAGLPAEGDDVNDLYELPAALCTAIDVKLVQIDVPLTCTPGVNVLSLAPIDAQWNAFVCGDYTGLSDAKGKVGVAGEFTPAPGGFSIAEWVEPILITLDQSRQPSNPQAFQVQNAGESMSVFYVGDHAGLTSAGQIYGNAVHTEDFASAFTITSSVTLKEGGSYVHANPIAFPERCQDFRSLSQYLKGVPSYGVAIPQFWGGLKLLCKSGAFNKAQCTDVTTSGSQDFTYVFHVNATPWANGAGGPYMNPGDLVVPDNSSILVSFENAATIRFQDTQIKPKWGNTNPGEPHGVEAIFNFPDTGDLTLNRFGIEGNLFAPYATVHLATYEQFGFIVAGELYHSVNNWEPVGLRIPGWQGHLTVQTDCAPGYSPPTNQTPLPTSSVTPDEIYPPTAN